LPQAAGGSNPGAADTANIDHCVRNSTEDLGPENQQHKNMSQQHLKILDMFVQQRLSS
jgi:hypothetical protein